MALSVDAYSASGSLSATSIPSTVTGINANDVVVVMAQLQSASGVSDASISDTSSLTWTQRTHVKPGYDLWTFWARAPSAIASDVITVSRTLSAANPMVVWVMSVSGAPATGSPFDTNAALPNDVTAGNPSISTTASNTLAFAIGSCNAGKSAGTGWTGLNNQSLYSSFAEYQILSSPVSALAATLSTGTYNGGIGDAIVAAGAAPPSWIPSKKQKSYLAR